MSISTFDIFRVENGPSGSHIAAPMIAAGYLHVQTVDEHPIPYPFRSIEELLQMCKESSRTIADLMLENEKCWRSTYDIRAGLLEFADAMEAPIALGCSIGGKLPVPIRMQRGDAERYQQQSERGEESLGHPSWMVECVDLCAIAVSEESATADQIATVPTIGAAGVIPAVLQYYREFVPGANENGVVDFLLTAAAIGIAYRKNASIARPRVDNDGEVGVTCSMAAAGLMAVLGGSNEQIANAIEIGLEHNLVMTGEPVEGGYKFPVSNAMPRGDIKASLGAD